MVSSEIIKKKDISVGNHKLDSYSFNYLEETKKQLIQIFNSLNFVIETGEEVVNMSENFDDLCFPEIHPSKSETETFYLFDDSDNMFEKKLLRTHCTSNSVIYLKNLKEFSGSVRLMTLGCVYRRDDETTRHTHQFNQLDFIWLKKDLNVTHLKWFLGFLCKKIFGSLREYRFRSSYFPFTQPSVEVDVVCLCKKQENCSICKGSGWIEILGAGMIRHEILKNSVFKNNSIECMESYACIAGGLGVERIALIKYGLKDIRDLYENNFLYLKN